jgi:hypothetical protein
MRRAVAVVIIFTVFALPCCTWRSRSRNITKLNYEVRAVSLKSLQETLRTCQPRNSCPPETFDLAAINKIDGVIVDEKGGDLILFGRTQANSPPLRLEDFIVALRNVWMKYASTDGGVTQYTPPGCSIDPVPEVLEQLNSIGRKITGSNTVAGKTDYIEEWRHNCTKPQSVRVMGVPFDSHFAQVLVKADYDMKSIVNGTDKVGVAGLVSLSDMMFEAARNEVLEHRPITVAPSSLHRFWFYPGQSRYEENDGIVFIRECPVKLLTEQMYLSHGGGMVGAGTSDSMAGDFVESFTAHYEEVAEKRPIYSELNNLFRFVAAAEIIKSSRQAAGIDLSYLLEAYPLAQTAVSRTLPGRDTLKEFSESEGPPQGGRTVQLWLPSCGGVDIALGDDLITRQRSQLLDGLKADIVGSRKGGKDFYWTVADRERVYDDNLSNQRTGDINRSDDRVRLLTVVYSPPNYVVYDGGSGEFFRGSKVSDFVKKLGEAAGGNRERSFVFSLKDFPDEKADAFVKTFNRLNSQQGEEAHVSAVMRDDGITDLQEVLFSRDVELEGHSVVEQITNGPLKGGGKARITFRARVKGALKRIAVTIVSASREAVQEFVGLITSHFASRTLRADPLAAVIAQYSRVIREKYPGTEFSVTVEEEIKGIEVGGLDPGPLRLDG